MKDVSLESDRTFSYVSGHRQALQSVGETNLLTSYCICYHRILKRRSLLTCDDFIQAQRKKYQHKTILMTAVTIGAFLLSWSPYAVVSLLASIKGHHVLSSGEAEIPELLAKASVIYNPIIYTFMNDKFRHTLWGILSGNRGQVEPGDQTRNGTVTENGSVYPDQSTTF